MIYGVLCFFAALAVISMLCTLLFQLAVWKVVNRPAPQNAHTPPVTILKPLRGIDEGLLDNLRSVARQDYPTFELIFGIEDPNDPARGVVETLQKEFPQVPMTLVVASPELGRNPKVNNLAGMAARARYEYFLISDANVRVATTYLRDVVAEFADAKVGLVCNVISGHYAQSMGALFEDIHLSTYIAPAVCGATELGGHPCVVGKSMLMRRTDLQSVGGWHIVRNILAEDYVLGQRYFNAGWKVRLSPYVVHAVHVRRSVPEFVARHVRWAQMRRRVSTTVYFGELLLNPTPFCFGMMLLALLSPDLSGAVAGAAMMAVKCLADTALMLRLSGRRLAVWQMLTIPFKDCLTLYIWLVGFFRRKVAWRGHTMMIGQGSRLIAPDEDDPGLLVGSEI